MCNALPMLTNVSLDGALLETARRLGKHRTKEEAVVAALEEYIQARKQLQILKLFGTVSQNEECRNDLVPSLT